MNASVPPGAPLDPPRRPQRLRPRSWFLLIALAVVAGALTVWYFAAADAPPSPPVAVATPDAAVTPDVVVAPAAVDSTAPPRQVVAYYFHTNYRCASCRKIEATAQHALNIGFAAELADKRLVWRVVNVEEKGNEHFIKDYQLYTKSVVLSDERSGRQVRWKNLAKVWQLLNDEADFVDYVQTETRAYLDDVP